MSTRHCSRHGFTLLELLVVVAVIALLLAILLPALSAANEMGRAAVCGTNQYQLLQGAIAYSEDNDFMMPWYAFASRRPEGWEWWVTQVSRGMDSWEPQVYTCPSDPVPYEVPVYIYNGLAYMNDGRLYSGEGSNPLTNAPNDKPLREDHADGRTMWLKISFRGACTHIVSGGGWNTGPGEARRITEFARPHKTMVLVEGMQWDQNGKSPVTMHECVNLQHFGSIVNRGASRKIYPSWLRHFGVTNVGFMDGHVESMEPVSMATLAMAWRDQMKPAFRNRFRSGPGKTKPPAGWYP
ncbi:MAG TPA: prepilin-type N-terminal cleavage/methylation domain-containing protein [Candidatus Latescibacteria bacterium]|nr:prepilin-type N-terminal cleavage/methylation domain-containing protein [Candidatus Latescibacterota bacterium]